jgi:hypothetical protein
MDFKLRYHISKETDMEPDELIERILFQLNDKKYRIIDVTNKSVKFNTNPWMPKPNWTPTKLDGGEFEIVVADAITTLSFKYYDNFLPPLIAIALFFIVTINDTEYQAILFFGIFFSITGIIHNVTIRTKAKEMLNAIVDIPLP